MSPRTPLTPRALLPHAFQRALAPLLALSLVACGGGGGDDGGGGGGSTAPTGLSYSVGNAIYVTGVEVTNSASLSSGSASAYSITPALAAGLSFDTSSGAITGTPSATAASSTHTIEATGGGGSSSTMVTITVVDPPHFTYVAGSGDDAIGIYSVSADSGRLEPVSYQGAAAGEDIPEQIVVDAARGFLWTPNMGDPVAMTAPTISTYVIDPATGLLAPGAPTATGTGPHRMALGADGSVAYVTSMGSDQIQTFDVNAGTGALTLSDTDSPGAGSGPLDVVVDPLGRFVWTLNVGDATISTFDVNPGTGTLTENAAGSLTLAGVVSSLTVDPAGTNLYATIQNFDNVAIISIEDVTGDLSVVTTRGTGDMPLASAVHPNGDFLFVVNGGDEDVSIFAIEPDNLTALGGMYPAGDGPNSICLDASGNYAYVTNADSNDVSVYDVDQGSGVLTLSETVRSRTTPVSVGVTTGAAPLMPAPQFLYTLGTDDDSINAFSVDPVSGALMGAGGGPIMTGDAPSSFAVDPMGRFLVAVNGADETVQSFTIGAGGGPAPASGPMGGMGAMRSVAIDPSGRFAFVTAGSNVLVYMIDQSNGTLAFTGTRPVDADSDAIAIDPSGRFVYVASPTGGGMGGGRITSFAFDQDALGNTGALVTSSEQTTLGIGTANTIRFNSEGTLAYLPLPNSNLVVHATVDPVTGKLTSAGQNPEPTRPLAVSLTPCGDFAFAAVADTGGDGHLAAFSVNANGSLTDLTDLASGMNPSDVVVGPGGRFLFATHSTGDDVVVATIDAEGALSIVATMMTGDTLVSVLVTRQFL